MAKFKETANPHIYFRWIDRVLKSLYYPPWANRTFFTKKINGRARRRRYDFGHQEINMGLALLVLEGGPFFESRNTL